MRPPPRLRAGAFLALIALSSCGHRTVGPTADIEGPPITAPWTVPNGSGQALTPLRFADIPGWSNDHSAEALPAFLASCGLLRRAPAPASGGSWRSVCDAGLEIPAGNDAAARRYFETNFQPFGVSADGTADGLYTGYYEPEMAGDTRPSSRYRWPLYRRPDLGGRTALTRAQIDAGALRNKRLEMFWLADPVDVFFLHIQGSGRVRLPDGQVLRVSYDGQNGHPYVPIGRVLVDRGEMPLSEVTMQTIRAWLEAHPDQAQDVMNRNPSYVFFREVAELDPNRGPPGASGAALTPMRSIAVDKTYVPLGAPVWLETLDPVDGGRIRRLMVAQDVGGAIRGAVRADIFFGWGADAENRAGKMRRRGFEIILLPKADQTASR